MSEGLKTPTKRTKQVSFSPQNTPGKTPTKHLDDTLNDDDQEKMERRLQEEAKRRRSSFHVSAGVLTPDKMAPPTVPSRRKSMAIRKMAPAALEDLFKNCIKLSTENKINAKNAWSLNLIDYIDEVIENQGEQSNFQIASSTLDASMKIYSCKVDSVHSDTFKVLGGLNRADGKPLEDDDEEENLDITKEGELVEKEKKEPRKKKTGGSTIETNVAKLNLNKFDMEFSIQPLSYSSQKDFDVGSAKSLLLNHLMVSEKFEVILDQEKYKLFGGNTEEVVEQIRLDVETSFQLDISTHSVGAIEMAPPSPIQQRTSPKQLVEEEVGPTLYDQDFGGNDSDNEFQPVLATNTSINNSRIEEKPTNVVEHLLREAIEGDQVLDFTNAYSYVQVDSKLAKKNWTGMNHWKVTKKPTEKKKRMDKTIIKEFLDFEHPTCDYETDFACSDDAEAHTMAASTLTKNANSTNLLPEDVHYKLEDLMKPFNLMKQQVSYVRKAQNSRPLPSEEPEEADYEGGGDVGGYSFHEDNDAERADPVEILLDTANLVPIKLVEAPKLAQKLDIGYAKSSSKVDVKLLKENIWEDIKDVRTNKNFSQMYVETEQKQPSSISFAFLCLLHLANEKGLEITGREDLSDLNIKLMNYN